MLVLPTLLGLLVMSILTFNGLLANARVGFQMFQLHFIYSLKISLANLLYDLANLLSDLANLFSDLCLSLV